MSDSSGEGQPLEHFEEISGLAVTHALTGKEAGMVLLAIPETPDSRRVYKLPCETAIELANMLMRTGVLAEILGKHRQRVEAAEKLREFGETN